MNLTRSRDGQMIHKPHCKIAGGAVGWVWAHDKTSEQILIAAAENGLRPCRRCKPLHPNAITEESQ